MDRPDPATTTGGPGGRQIVLGRAIAVIVVAVVLGVLILHAGSPSSVALPSSHVPVPGSTVTTVPPTASSTSTTVSRAAVKVLVANDSTVSLVASGYATALQHAGWTVLPAVDAKPPVQATSSVYYATNERAQADVVAAALGLSPSVVLPVSPATPVSSTTGADVIVIVGSDLAAKSPPTTVPPVASTTTTTVKSHKS